MSKKRRVALARARDGAAVARAAEQAAATAAAAGRVAGGHVGRREAAERALEEGDDIVALWLVLEGAMTCA